MNGTITHIAGLVVHVGSMVRQRCGWCGAVLIDLDLANTMVMVPDGHDPEPPPTWEVGALVALNGAASWVVDHEDGAQLPADACAQLDPAVTR